ncbi:uncharacterized protein LOC112576402 isoform X2 [Pomacea canaliculata]|uniref:uncharacterized protein LOC112576402 isoform X2 n=1 Tax=Pomacea canaliculata TaxID=400727 RepID=UPI000D737745|nr:uncharacterized protein LOC112576402 isoform X2 [Pomacea canaliculata]
MCPLQQQDVMEVDKLSESEVHPLSPQSEDAAGKGTDDNECMDFTITMNESDDGSDEISSVSKVTTEQPDSVKELNLPEIKQSEPDQKEECNHVKIASAPLNEDNKKDQDSEVKTNGDVSAKDRSKTVVMIGKSDVVSRAICEKMLNEVASLKKTGAVKELNTVSISESGDSNKQEKIGFDSATRISKTSHEVLSCNGNESLSNSAKQAVKEKVRITASIPKSQSLLQMSSANLSASLVARGAPIRGTVSSALAAKRSMVLDARTGASVSKKAGTGPSLLTSGSSVRLVLPSVTSSVTGPALMYIPSTGTFLNSGTAPPLILSAAPTTVSLTSSTSVLIPSLPAKGPYAFPGSSSGQSYILSGTARLPAGVVQQNMTNATALNMPEKPTSSQGMINMLRWEAENHINVRPKYVKPNPKAELGNLAKWIFDLGSDLVKEYVYHDLVRIQSKRKDDGKLTDKEKADFNKLKEIDEELHNKVGHLKIKFTKACKCGFRTESPSVLRLHKENAHFNRGFLSCPMCNFFTRTAASYRFHMEAEHNAYGRVENRPSFFECSLCPYETNHLNRLEQHKVRCAKQFRPAFNMHPSCLSGPEVNMCLENVFYFVFTRQFLNTITKTPLSITAATTVGAALQKKELVTKGAVSQYQPATTLLAVAGSVAATTITMSASKPTSKSLPKFQSNSSVGKAGSISQTFPVISSKIGATVHSVQPSTPVTSQGNQPNSGFEVCEICGGYVKDRKALRIHLFYAHRIDMPFGVFERAQPPLYCATCFARFWTAQGLQKHIEIHKADAATGVMTFGNGVSGKCITCGHRVPNILMHMRMVHNRELRHYLAALMCIFCGNRFSSKSDVEAHMGSHHGVVVKNSSVQSSVSSKPSHHLQPPVSATPQDGTKSILPKSAEAANSAPGPSSSKDGGGNPTRMNRGSQCVLCNLTFARNVDLTRHCMRVHHTCMKCGLVVVDKESLSRHTCLHSAAGMRTCQICNEAGFHPAYYIKHMRDKHLRRCSVVLSRLGEGSLKRQLSVSDSEEEDSEPSSPKPSPSTIKRQKLEGNKENDDALRHDPCTNIEASVDVEKNDRKRKSDDDSDVPVKKLERESDVIELD